MLNPKDDTINIHSVRSAHLVSNRVVDTHTHDYFECIVTNKGKGEIICDGMTFKMKSNNVCVIKPGKNHAFKNTGTEDFTFNVIKFSVTDSSYNDFFMDISEGVIEDKSIFSYISILNKEADSTKPFSTNIYITSARQILYLLLRLHCPLVTRPERKDTGSDIEDIYRVFDHLEYNIDKEITVKEMADLVFLEQTYFLKKFKKVTGMTPAKYLKEMRMTKAANLLCTTDMTIEQIVKASGYSNIYYFNKVFTEYYKTDPVTYKKSAKANKRR